MTEKRQHFDPELLNVVSYKNDLMDYLKSLSHLNGKMSKDATSYANLSSIVKRRLASFKSIFGELKSNLYCDEATIVYSRLLKTFRQYEPEFVCKLYDEWRDMLSVFSKSSRANSFIKYIHKFECIVEYLQSANDRCNRLIALSIIRRYTKKVNFEKIRDFYTEGLPEYLRVIQEIILISHQHKTIRNLNAFLSAMNSINGLILSFQPNRIVCGDELYVLSDHEMWIDFNIHGKSISFTVMSMTKDKSKNLCGISSRKKFKIVSRQGDLFIKSIWSLSSCNSETKKMAIEFGFPARVHTNILESNVASVFKIVIDKVDEPKVNNLKSEAKSTLKQIPTSINEIRFVEPENLQTSAHSAQNVIQRMVEDTAILAVPNEEEKFDQKNERQYVEQVIEIQSATTMKTGDKSCVKTLINENEATALSVKNEFRKRRKEADNDGRNINDAKRVCKEPKLENPSSTEVLKHQSISIKSVAPSVDRDIEMNAQDRINQSNGQHIHNMAEVILMAAGNMIRTSQNTALNADGNKMRNERKQENVVTEQVSNRPEAKQQCSMVLQTIHRLGFDTTVYKERWIIRKFINAITTEPDYGEEIDENLHPIFNVDINETYDSISSPKLIVE